MIEIKEICAEATYGIRKSILRKGMSLTHKMVGDDDKDSLHLGVFFEDKLVCVGSFMKSRTDLFQEQNQYQLRGMASEADAQGKGYGKLLLRQAEQILKSKGVKILWCNARVTAIPFYIKLGYQMKGDEFDVPQVGRHMVLYRHLD